MSTTRAVLVAALLAACVTPKPEHLTPDAAPGAISFGGGGKGGPDPLGMIGTFLSTLKRPGPWDELERANGASALSEHQALLTLEGGVSELESMSFFGGGGTPLRKLQERLRVLAKDPMVSGFVIRLGDLSLGATAAEELRLTLASLGKPVDCHADAIGGAAVVAAAGCASVTLSPGGAIELQGPYLAPLFLHGLFAKVGVDAHFVQMGAYKGAAEALTRDAPSPEMKETYDAIVAGQHAHLVAALAAWRKVDAGKAKGWIDHALYEADDAKQEGLIDGIQPYEAWLAAKAPKWVRTELEPDPTPADTLARLLGTTPRPSGPHVALLYAVGSIVDGAGSNGSLGAREEIAPRRLVAAIRAAAADDSVKVIVLRIDSPGGSALASELIAQALEEAAQKKPIVASMGSVAASGGYYIAAGAKVIYAQPDTLTGSIGVIGGKIVYGPALAGLGVNVYPFSRGAKAGMFSPVARFSPEEVELITQTMRATYDRFKGRVAAGRKLDLAAVEKIAQGRVWLGSDALDRKLVDKLGGLDAALAEAKTLGGLPVDAPVDAYPGPVTLRDLLSGLGEVDARTLQLRAALATVGLIDPRAEGAIRQTLDLVLSFQHEHVQAAAFLPMIR